MSRKTIVTLRILEDPTGVGYPSLKELGILRVHVGTTVRALRVLIADAIETGAIKRPQSTRYGLCDPRTETSMFVSGLDIHKGGDEGRTLRQAGMKPGGRYKLQWTPSREAVFSAGRCCRRAGKD